MAVGSFCIGKYDHKIDDDELNVLPEAGLLHVFRAGNLKVKLSDGSVDLLKNYCNDPKLLVLKVYKTDTTIPETDIRLYK